MIERSSTAFTFDLPPQSRNMTLNPRSILTLICALTLGLSFAPGLNWLAYLSVLTGSIYAFESAWESLKNRELDVNVLMIVAAVGAIAIQRTQDAAALFFLFSLSTMLESMAMAKTKSAIEKLMALRPNSVFKVENGIETEIPIEQARAGDHILIRAFDKIALDGEIIQGSTSVDESSLTGESVPVEKQLGANVVAGTQNLSSSIVIKVTQADGNSSLDRIIALVKESQENKASGEKISQWFGQKYTVFVLLAFFTSWGVRLLLNQPPQDAFYFSLILLVGLSPCALVISTPAATLSALAKAARSGILVRGGEFIENAASINFIAMDKTGTITEGKPVLMHGMFVNIQNQSPISDNHTVWNQDTTPDETFQLILQCVSSVESHSSHPIGEAFIRTAKQFGVTISPPTHSETLPGLGLSSTVLNSEWKVGSDKLLKHFNIEIPEVVASQALIWKKEGRTTVFASGILPSNKMPVIAVFALGDSIRREARTTIADLYKIGIKRVMMLTGDKHETAEKVAEQVGLKEFNAELLPSDKTQIIQKLTEQGNVMMVGDGVNDAPSLALASVGIAMGGLGSDVALEAADVVLMNDRLSAIPELILLGRRTRGIIRANMTIAISMISCLTIASFVTKLPLPLAVLGHEGSTVIVILNGLRLLK